MKLPYISTKKELAGGLLFNAGLYSEEGHGDQPLHYRIFRNGASDCKCFWRIKINRTYGSNKIERFILMVS